MSFKSSVMLSRVDWWIRVTDVLEECHASTIRVRQFERTPLGMLESEDVGTTRIRNCYNDLPVDTSCRLTRLESLSAPLAFLAECTFWPGLVTLFLVLLWSSGLWESASYQRLRVSWICQLTTRPHIIIIQKTTYWFGICVQMEEVDTDLYYDEGFSTM